MRKMNWEIYKTFPKSVMSELEPEISEKKKRQEKNSVRVALIAVAIIALSFFWHLGSAFFSTPAP